MRFSKISITKAGVHLVRQTKDGNGAIEEVDLSSPEKPLGSFVDALQSFKSFVRELLPFPLTEDQLTVTTLSLSEDKNHLRGLIVTATVPVEKAYNKPVVLNTPLVREGGENAGPEAFVLADEVLEMITLAEEEATRYAKGERVQLDLLSKEETTSENAKDFDQRAASAEVASTRKPKGRRNQASQSAAEAEAQTNTWNPDKSEPMTTANLRQLLLTVERDVPEDAIAQWTSSERDAAQRWGEARQQEILGRLPTDRMPREPECVIKASNASLADGWTDAAAPKPDAAGIAAIKSSAGPSVTHPHIQ